MVILTLIARVRDGMPLATSIEGDEEHDHNMVKYTNQAKLLFRKLNAQSPEKCTLESGPYIFHYLLRFGVCYLCLCDRNFPSKSAFAFLEDIAVEFASQHGSRIEQVPRPYHFIEFDQYIQQAKRKFTDRGRFGLSSVSSELQDVTRIMVANIEDVIHRGEALNILDDKAANLAGMSKKYKEDARQLNLRSTFFKVLGLVILIVFVLVFLRFRFW